MGRSWRKLAAGAGGAGALVAGGIVGLTHPHEMIGGAGWAIAVGGVLYGLGAGARRIVRADLGPGEQLALGALVWILTSGILLAVGQASRGPLFAIAGLGLALALHEIATLARAPSSKPVSTDETRWVAFGLAAILIAFLTFNLLGMLGTRGNPYDDHVAYTPLVKRMLDCGNLIEPFSFRRISAYGGQTTLLALAGLRGDVETIDLLDRGIFQAIAVLLVLDLLRRRRLHLGVMTIVVAFLLCLWDLSINSASAWTGVVCFLAAYGFASREDLPPRTALVLTLAACAGACTLRQNFLLPAGLFAALLLWFHVRAAAAASSWRAAWVAERTTIVIAIGVAGAIVVPYMVAAWASSRTFLYPILLGTYNPAAPLRPTAGTLFDEAAFAFAVALRSDPIRIWWILIPFMFLARDTSARRPWRAFLLASWIGFAYLVHSFTLSDPNTLWRYGFGYLTPLALIFFIETATLLPTGEHQGTGTIRLPAIGTLVVWLALLVQLVLSRDVAASRMTLSIQNIKKASALGSTKLDTRVDAYHEMQALLPEGARVAVLLDDPYLLDFARNRIVNLDLPGFAAPGPGLPSFTDPEHWRSYFTAQGIRYVCFVAKEYSTYLFRRPAWLWRMYGDDELWRFMGAHMIDTLDALHELARTSQVVFHSDGLYAIDLGTRVTPEADRGGPELARMDAYARRLSEQELGSRAWQLTSRSDVVFQTDGYGPTTVAPPPGGEDPDDSGPLARGLVGLLLGKPHADPPHRWMMDRTHVRVHGTGKQRLHVKAWINKRRLSTTPTVTLTVDGQPLARSVPGPDGTVTFDAPVSCSGWCDVYILLSTISEYWRSADDLQAAKLLEFDWAEAP